MNIVINKISINNFLSVGNIDFDFQDKGLVLVQGIVEDCQSSDSNGAGKSALIDSLCWGFFDDTLRGISKDNVVNDKIGKDCFVKIECKVNDVDVIIERYRKHSTKKNQVKIVYNGNDISENSDTVTNKKIQEIIGMNFDDFQTNIVFSNNSLKFLELGDTDKKRLFDSIVKSDLYEKCIENVKSIVLDLEKKIVSENNEKIKYETMVKSTEEKLKDAKDRSEFFEIERQRKTSEIKNTIELNEKELTTLNVKYIQSDIADVAFLDQQIIAKQNEINELNQKQREMIDNEELNELLKNHRQQKQEKEDILNKLITDQKQSEQRLNDYRIKSSETQNEIKIYLNQIDSLNKRNSDALITFESYQKAMSDKKCPTCNQTISNDNFFKEKIDNLNLQFVEIKNSANDINEKIKIKQKELEEIVIVGKSESKILEAKTKEVELIKNEIKLIESEHEKNVQQIKKIHMDKAKIFIDQIQVLNAEIIAIQKTKDDHQKVLSSIKEEIKNKEQEIKTLNTRMEMIKEEKNLYAEHIKIEQQKLIEYNDKLNTQLKKISEINTEIDDHKYWTTSFKKIKGLLISTITPLMNEKAAEYSSILTNDEFNIEFITQKKNKDDTIKEVFDVNVSRKNGGQKYESLSSGEKRRVDLIIVFVLDELKRVNCLHNINIRFYDEVFDAVDELGTEKIIGLLNVIAEKKQVFVVTHRNNMKDLFKNSITILKKKGFSELRRNIR